MGFVYLNTLWLSRHIDVWIMEVPLHTDSFAQWYAQAREHILAASTVIFSYSSAYLNFEIVAYKCLFVCLLKKLERMVYAYASIIN